MHCVFKTNTYISVTWAAKALQHFQFNIIVSTNFMGNIGLKSVKNASQNRPDNSGESQHLILQQDPAAFLGEPASFSPSQGGG